MTVSLHEVQQHWSLEDLWDANAVLDELERVEAEARAEAEAKRDGRP